MGRTLLALLLAGLFGHASLSLRAQQLLDDFNVPASGTVGGAWVETETAATGAQINGVGQLQLGSTVSGREFIAQDVSGLYGTTYNTNSCVLTWAFCMRQSRSTTDPSGFVAGEYGVAYVLGASGPNLVGAGVTGYAVLFGQGGGTDPLRLVRFTGGLNTNAGLTNVITAGPAPWNDLTNQYFAVRVTFTPSTGTWNMYTTALSAATFSTFDPRTAATLVGTAVNTTYTATNLAYTGCLWNHNTAAGESALFDSFYVP